MMMMSNNIVFGDIDSDIVTFFGNYIGLRNLKLGNIKISDNSFDHYDPETINHVRLMAGYNTYMQHKSCKRRCMSN